MTLSEAKKQSNKRYDDRNMAYQTVKVNKELLQQFKQAVQSRGDRVNTVLRQAMIDYINKE